MDEWNLLGRYVNKGSKAKGFKNKTALFSHSQTHKAKDENFQRPSSPRTWHPSDLDQLYDSCGIGVFYTPNMS